MKHLDFQPHKVPKLIKIMVCNLQFVTQDVNFFFSIELFITYQIIINLEKICIYKRQLVIFNPKFADRQAIAEEVTTTLI